MSLFVAWKAATTAVVHLDYAHVRLLQAQKVDAAADLAHELQQSLTLVEQSDRALACLRLTALAGPTFHELLAGKRPQPPCAQLEFPRPLLTAGVSEPGTSPRTQHLVDALHWIGGANQACCFRPADFPTRLVEPLEDVRQTLRELEAQVTLAAIASRRLGTQ
jgi:hypothetical protein